MKKLGMAVLAGLALTAGVVFTASKSDGDVLREVRDRQEIEDLTWRYARALDTNDAEAYASVYAPDGQFGTGANATKGRDALRKMIADSRQRQVEAQAKVDKLVCWKQIEAVNVTFDERGKMLQFHRLENREMVVDNRQDMTRASGPG